MSTVAKWFFTSAIAYGLLGILLGLHMAMTHNHDQRPTHAHMQVIGFVSFFLFGLFYDRFSAVVRKWLAWLHLAVAQFAMLGIMVGLWLLYSGHVEYEPVAALASLAYAASFAIFAVVALPAIWGSRE